MKKRYNSNSNRQQKAASLINQALIDVLRRGKMLDARLLNCPLTITEIRVNGDLKSAHCYFVPFNTNLTKIELLEALNASKYVIRSLVTSKIQLKFSPEIHFYYDEDFENAVKIEEFLQKNKNSTQDNGDLN